MKARRPGAPGCRLSGMCRNIRTLFNFEPPATEEEIRASALQFVRKLSGFNKPSQANQAAFDRAVERVQADGSVVARHWAEFYATRLDLQAQHTAQDKAAEVNADVPRELADSTVAQPRAVTGAKRAALAAGIHDTT